MPMINWTSALACLAVVSMASPALAELTPAQLVSRAMDQQVFRNRGAEMKIEMRLIARHGKPRQRLLLARTLRQDDLSRTMARVLAPADVAGMAFLFNQKKGAADDQFMYMPALKMVKRIVGSQKSSRFLGSQFTYGDLEWRAVEDASYRRLPAQNIGKDLCHVIEARPTGDSEYGVLKLWIRQKDDTMLRVQFFDKRAALKKVLFVKRVERIGGRLVATRLKMKDARNGDSTLLAVTNIRFRKDLSPRQFSLRELKKR